MGQRWFLDKGLDKYFSLKSSSFRPVLYPTASSNVLTQVLIVRNFGRFVKTKKLSQTLMLILEIIKQKPIWRISIFWWRTIRTANVIEHANAWIDSFKALLVRFESEWRTTEGYRLNCIDFISFFSSFFTQNQN